MKKIIILALVLTTLATTAFSNYPDRFSDPALNSFNKTYSNATEVKWESLGEYMKVSFTLDSQRMSAYYNNMGEQVAITRNIRMSQLPLPLMTELKSKCTDRWITELFELSSKEETAYFATLYSADHILILRGDPAGGWSTFRKKKRTAE